VLVAQLQPVVVQSAQVAQVEVDVLVGDAEQAGREVAEHHVVGRLGNGLVKGQIGLHLLFENRRRRPFGKQRLDLRVGLADTREVGVGGAAGGQRGGLGLEHAAKLQQVGLQVGVLAQHLAPRVGKTGVKPVGHPGAAALAAVQQALGNQFLDRLAQGRAGHAQLDRQLALGLQAIAGLERALENAPLEFVGDGVGQALDCNLADAHGTTL
jgi:hypothetical protein